MKTTYKLDSNDYIVIYKSKDYGCDKYILEYHTVVVTEKANKKEVQLYIAQSSYIFFKEIVRIYKKFEKDHLVDTDLMQAMTLMSHLDYCTLSEGDHPRVGVYGSSDITYGNNNNNNSNNNNDDNNNNHISLDNNNDFMGRIGDSIDHIDK